MAQRAIAAPPVSIQQPRTTISPVNAQALDVLIVDDNPVNRELLDQMVARLGHRTVVASDGLTAATISARHRFDLVLTDIRMPGVDGYRTAALIREGGASRNATIIGVTAHLNQFASERAAAAAAGFADFLIKPFALADLARVIAEHVDGARGQVDTDGEPRGIDPERVDILRQMNGTDAYDRLLAQTMMSIADIAGQIELHPEGETDPALADEVHQLIGTCAALGLLALCEVLRDCEDVLRGRPTTGLPDLRQAAAAAADAIARYQQVA
jgi:CheY-like chemotaxis protein